VLRISHDTGEAFGPMLRLAANSTISSTEDEATATDLQLEKKDKQIIRRRRFLNRNLIF
jgi:hypothetical protein